jgi:glycosyltransferase involved in cell wall biosynthesis
MMKVAVITPYYKESLDVLEKCHSSVLNQTIQCQHVLVADGFPKIEIENWNVHHIILPIAHNDIGSTPRLIGSYHAIGLGFNAIAFLDADNWYQNDHIESLLNLYENTKAAFLSSSRMLCRIDGSVMAPCNQTDPETFIDTNCMMFTTNGFGILANWVLMPEYAHLIGDRVMLHLVKESGVIRAHSGLCTVFYRCSKEGIYRALGEIIPEGVMARPNYEKSLELWVKDGNPALI